MALLKKYYISLFFTLLSVGTMQAQTSHTEICIDFRVNSTVIDSAYSDNAANMREMLEFIKKMEQDSTISIVDVSFCGAASPEGSYQLNRRLANGRLSALENLIRSEVEIPDSIIYRNDSYIPWDFLRSEIAASDMKYKDEIISILDEESRLVDYHQPNSQIDSRINKLKALDKGRVWQQINRRFFERMRNACVVLVTFKKEIPPVVEPEPEPIPEPEPVVVDTVVPVVEPVVEPEMWTGKLHIKTNLVGWGLGISNLGVEVDLGQHWSFALPVYYSAWNYFKLTTKYRTFAIQPEIRYWLSGKNKGFFAGAHFGMAYYNIATNGDYRYQDHGAETPALGGGISLGYRLPLSKNGKWNVEFVVGGGVYKLHYDRFYNVENGKLHDTQRKTYWGLDNAAINFSYCFDLYKRKK